MVYRNIRIYDISKNLLDLPGLNCIEVNSTFYSLPSKKTVNNWNKPRIISEFKN